MDYHQSGTKDTKIELCADHRPYLCTQSLLFYKTHELQHQLNTLDKTYNQYLYAQHLVNRLENIHRQHNLP
ncbi:hypothetical protein SG64_07650 [Enterobacter hormaechei subsp. xiangfangensis]|nr:hypothetical protein SG64_07650 [Enterobacter hormaechei subsp. xiangfangensis]